MKTTIDYDGKPSDYQTTMAENPSGTIDYDSLTRGKLCPLKAVEPPALTIWNSDPAPDRPAGPADLQAVRRDRPDHDRADRGPARVEYIGGQCDGSRCAWYDEMKEQCAILSLARSVSRSTMHK